MPAQPSGTCRDDEPIGNQSVAHKPLLAVEHELGALAPGRQPDVAGALSGGPLLPSERQNRRTVGDTRQELFLLSGASCSRERGRTEQRTGEKRAGKQRLAHLFEDDGRIEERSANAAELRGNQQAEPAHRRELLPELVRMPGFVFHHLSHERDRTRRVEELASALPQHLLLFAESEVHRGFLKLGPHTTRPREGQARAESRVLTERFVLRYRGPLSPAHGRQLATAKPGARSPTSFGSADRTPTHEAQPALGADAQGRSERCRSGEPSAPPAGGHDSPSRTGHLRFPAARPARRAAR